MFVCVLSKTSMSPHLQSYRSFFFLIQAEGLHPEQSKRLKAMESEAEEEEGAEEVVI